MPKYTKEQKHQSYLKHKSKQMAQQRIYRAKPDKSFNRYRYAARDRKIVWELTFDEFMQYWNKPCYYCGNNIETIGLDRVNNNKGYIDSNIIPCCKTCNRMKTNMNAGVWIEHMIQIINKLGDRNG